MSVVGVDLGGDDFGVAGVGELCPAVDAVPVLAEAGAVVEDDLDGDGKDEVAFAAEVDGGEILDLSFCLWIGEPPLDRVWRRCCRRSSRGPGFRRRPG